MYHVALIGTTNDVFKELEICAGKYFDKLVVLHGPFTDIASALEDGSYVGNITSAYDSIRISSIRPLEDETAYVAVVEGNTPPLRILIALLAVLENYEIRDREEMRSPGKTVLTKREIEVLQFVSGGYSNGEIAGFLDITERTVKYHVSEILRKLDVSGRTEAVVEAARNGIIAL